MEISVTSKEYKDSFREELVRQDISSSSADMAYKEILQNKDINKFGDPVEDANRILKGWDK